MKFLILILALALNGFNCQKYGECPTKEDFHCDMFDTENCPPGTEMRNTSTTHQGRTCDTCRMCLPVSAQSGCPKIECPILRIDDRFPTECVVFLYNQKARMDGRLCDVCQTFTINCMGLYCQLPPGPV